MVTYVVNFGSRNIVVCQQEINKFEGIRYYTYKVVSFGRDKAILYPTHCLRSDPPFGILFCDLCVVGE